MNSRCFNLPTMWTKPSITSARIWKRITSKWNPSRTSNRREKCEYSSPIALNTLDQSPSKIENGEEAMSFFPVFISGTSTAGLEKLVVRERLDREDRLKAPLLVLIVQHDHRHHAQRVVGLPARSRLALQILDEAIRKVISSPRPPCCFRALLTALRAGKFHAIF